MNTIETKRLIIKPLEYNDYNSWYKGYSNCKESQSPFDDGILDMSICTKEWFMKLVDKHQKMWKEDYQYIFGIFHKDGSHLGMINVVTLERKNFQWAELGYSIHNNQWRKGYALEALDELIHFLQTELEFHRIEAHVSIGNNPSSKLLEKLRFKYEGIRENFIFEDNQWIDKQIYAKISTQ